MKAENSTRIQFDSLSSNEAYARGVTAAFLARYDPTVPQLADLKTAVSEAVTNCIVHAYREDLGMIYINVKLFENGTIAIRARDKGCGIIYISHKMEEILRISDEVTIMRDGAWVATRPAAELTMEEIIRLMVGRELTNRFPPKTNEPGEVILQVEHLSGRYTRLKDASFQLKKGEILGVAGLVGAQRTELMEGIFGLRAHTSGKVWIKGEEVNIKQPRDAIQKSVALLTEDRRATGILGVLSVADNISIASLDALRKGPIMLDNKKILDLVATNKEKMAIKVPSPKTQIKSLSGGNQQKVLIARWLANNPDVLILDEPTRGIDVGAKYEIYCIIADLAKQGKSIIMISSEMSEIIGMSNRVMVMCLSLIHI